MKRTVTTTTGYRAEIETVANAARVEVKTAAYIFKGVLSPWVVLHAYEGEHAQDQADRYVTRLVAALKDEEERL